MKKIIQLLTVSFFIFLTACTPLIETNDEPVYTYKYLVDPNNFSILFRLNESVDKENDIFTLSLVSKDKTINYQDLVIEVNLITSGFISSTRTVILNQENNFEIIIESHDFLDGVPETKVYKVSGFVKTNTRLEGFEPHLEYNDDNQTELFNELENKLTSFNSNEFKLQMSLSLSTAYQTEKTYMTIEVDQEDKYFHSEVDGTTNTVLFQKDDQYILGTYILKGDQPYISVIDRINISDIDELEDYKLDTLKLDETFKISKFEDKYYISTTFGKLLETTNQDSTLKDALGELYDKEITYFIVFQDYFYAVFVEFRHNDVKINLQMTYVFESIDKIKLDDAIYLGDSVLSPNTPIQDPTTIIENQYIRGESQFYYRYNLDEGVYQFRVYDPYNSSTDLVYEVYDYDTHTRIDPKPYNPYLGLGVNQLFELKKGNYYLVVKNPKYYINHFNIQVVNILDFDTVFDRENPEYTNPNGETIINFEDSIDFININFTTEKSAIIEIKFEEGFLYDVRDFLKDDSYGYNNTNKINNSTYRIRIFNELNVILNSKEAHTAKVTFTVLHETPKDLINLEDNDPNFYLSYYNYVYEINLTEAAYLTLSFESINPYVDSLYIWLDGYHTDYDSIDSFTLTKTSSPLFLLPGRYKIRCSTSELFKLILLNIEKVTLETSHLVELENVVDLSNPTVDKVSYALYRGYETQIKFILNENSYVYLGTDSRVKYVVLNEEGINVNPLNTPIMYLTPGEYIILLELIEKIKTEYTNVTLYKTTDERILTDDYFNIDNDYSEIVTDEVLNLSYDYKFDTEIFKFTLLHSTAFSLIQSSSLTISVYDEDFNLILDLPYSSGIRIDAGNYYLKITYSNNSIVGNTYTLEIRNLW